MAALIALVVMSGCGDGGVQDSEPAPDEDGGGTDDTVLIVQVGGDGGDVEQSAVVEQSAAVVRARLDALGIDTSSVRVVGSAIEAAVPVGDEAVARAALGGVGLLEFRPVLELLGPAPTGDARESTPIDEQDGSTEIVVGGEGGQLYRLGPRAVVGDALEGATAVPGEVGQWTVNPVFRSGPDGIDAFNAIAQQCFSGAATCPPVSDTGRGLLAIVVDGEVVSAPSINVPSFERDQVQISGTWNEADAAAVAAKLSAPVSQVALHVAD